MLVEFLRVLQWVLFSSCRISLGHGSIKRNHLVARVTEQFFIIWMQLIMCLRIR